MSCPHAQNKSSKLTLFLHTKAILFVHIPHCTPIHNSKHNHCSSRTSRDWSTLHDSGRKARLIYAGPMRREESNEMELQAIKEALEIYRGNLNDKLCN